LEQCVLNNQLDLPGYVNTMFLLRTMNFSFAYKGLNHPYLVETVLSNVFFALLFLSKLFL